MKWPMSIAPQVRTMPYAARCEVRGLWREGIGLTRTSTFFDPAHPQQRGYLATTPKAQEGAD